MSWFKAVEVRSSAICLTLLVGCAGEPDETGDTAVVDTDTDPTVAAFALSGEWAEVAGDFPNREVWGHHTVSDTSWTDAFGSSYTIAEYGDDPIYAAAKNGASNGYFPDLWSRFDGVTDGDGGWYYCQTAFNAASQEAAAGTAPADATDPATTGCGTFPWSHLVPRLPIAGTWDDGFAAHTVDEATWDIGDDTFAVFDTDLTEGMLIAQNGADNAFSAGLWSRFEWVITSTTTSYCQSVFDATSANAASQAPRADAADLAAGCGGFPWSTLTPTVD